ncbi:MAG: zinc ribbon domain-containing protein [Candidatus Heimdallarchaeota archaeon]
MKHKVGFILLVIGGAIMIYSSTVGSIGVFEFLYELAKDQWPDYQVLFSYIFNIFRWIADLGGFAVIVGAIFVILGAVRFGKFIIWIGLAFGTLALIVWIITHIVNATGIITDPTILGYLNTLYSQFNYGTGLSFVGVVIAIIGRLSVRKVRTKKDIREKKEEEVGAIEPEQEVVFEESQPLEKKHCPECGTELPVFANFCSNCGKIFD